MNFYEYFENLTTKNKLCQDKKFFFARVSGPRELQEVVDNMTKKNNFLAVDDFSDGKFFFNGAGYFTTYTVTVFLFARTSKEMSDMIEKLNLCRTIREQFVSRVVLDSNDIESPMLYLDKEIHFHEYSSLQLNGMTGTHMQISFDIPTELCIDKNAWL